MAVKQNGAVTTLAAPRSQSSTLLRLRVNPPFACQKCMQVQGRISPATIATVACKCSPMMYGPPRKRASQRPTRESNYKYLLSSVLPLFFLISSHAPFSGSDTSNSRTRTQHQRKLPTSTAKYHGPRAPRRYERGPDPRRHGARTS